MSQSFTPAAEAERQAKADSHLPIHPALEMPTPMERATAGRTGGGPLTLAELKAAVHHDFGSVMDIAPEILDGVVEATLVQLGYGLQRFGDADLGYAGFIEPSLPDFNPETDNEFVFTPFAGGTDDGSD